MPTAWNRVALVTFALLITGFVCGAVVGTVIVLGTALAYGQIPTIASVPKGFVLGLAFGAPLGALAAPVAAWLLLRRVALGRAIGVTALGTALGGIVPARLAGLFGANEAAMLIAIPGALLGFIGSAIWLRMRSPRHRVVAPTN